MPVKPATHKPVRQITKRHEPPGQQNRYGQGRGGRPWRRKRERIFKRDKYLCQICFANGKLTPVSLHGPTAGICDHKVALTHGGTDDDDNLQTICKACDKKKTGKESNRKAL
jgi:5-methylcytosine-specific restriction protein A